MAERSAVIVTTSNGEDQVLQYIFSQLNELNIPVKDTCTAINDDKYFVEYIRKWHRNSNFVFYLGKQQFICNILSKVFDEPLVGNYRLAPIYEINTENIGDSEHIKLLEGSEIHEIENHANGPNHILIMFMHHIILPNDLNSLKTIIDKFLKPYFRDKICNEHFMRQLTFNSNQNGVDSQLNQFIHNVNLSVNIKRYYQIRDRKCQLNIILTSSNFNDITNCVKKIKQIIPNNIVKQIVAGSVWHDVKSVSNRDYVKEAMHVIENCFQRYKPKDVFLSFNGGKDCTVLLCLTLHVLKTSYFDYEEPLLTLYIQSPNPFSEVEAFIEKCQHFYNLKVVTINSIVKTGLRKLLTEQPHFKACLMGTRRTDPYSKHLNHFQMTDPGWPQIMRVNPILDWKYSDIWDFLLSCKIPYCELYDLGYTSLGSRTNTCPNPSLRTLDEATSVEKYLPAYKLQNGADERSGRLQK